MIESQTLFEASLKVINKIILPDQVLNERWYHHDLNMSTSLGDLNRLNYNKTGSRYNRCVVCNMGVRPGCCIFMFSVFFTTLQ